MRIIIVFSSPGILEYEDVWHRLIDQGHGYIKVKNDSCDKIYAFDGHNEEYRLAGEWKTDKLIKEIDNIIKNNNNCECMIMLHDRKIPEALTTRFPNRIKDYSHVGSKFYENYIEPFRNGDKQKCFDSLWKELHKIKPAENTPEEGTKAHARWLVENVIIHDFDNAITYLSIPINKILNDINSNSSKEDQQTILDFGEDFITKKVIYYASVKSIISEEE